VSVPFPGPTVPASSRAEVFLAYLDYFRSRLVGKLERLPSAESRASRLPSGWTPIQMLKHLAYVEMRWLEWGFEGRYVADPWADSRNGRWYVAPDETLGDLVAALNAQAARTRAIVEAHDIADIGRPGERWAGADPASLERILFHLLQEYARHVGHLDIVAEMAGGPVGELSRDRRAAHLEPGATGDRRERGGVADGRAPRVVVEEDEDVRVGRPGFGRPPHPAAQGMLAVPRPGLRRALMQAQVAPVRRPP